MLSEFCKLIEEKNVNELKFKMIEIGSEYDIVVVFNDSHEDYRNFSSIDWVITIGYYTDIDLMVASFFHELGHHLSKYGFDYENESLKFHQELDAWNVGLMIGQTKGYFIKPATYKLCMEKMLYSYIHYDIRESRRYFKSDASKYFHDTKTIKYYEYYRLAFDFNINSISDVRELLQKRYEIAESGAHNHDKHLKSDLLRADSKIMKVLHSYYPKEMSENLEIFKILKKIAEIIENYENYY